MTAYDDCKRGKIDFTVDGIGHAVYLSMKTSRRSNWFPASLAIFGNAYLLQRVAPVISVHQRVFGIHIYLLLDYINDVFTILHLHPLSRRAALPHLFLTRIHLDSDPLVGQVRQANWADQRLDAGCLIMLDSQAGYSPWLGRPFIGLLNAECHQRGGSSGLAAFS